MDTDAWVRKGDLLKKTKGIGIGSTRYRLWKPRTCVLLDVGTFFFYTSDDKKKGNSSVATINLRNPGSKVAPASTLTKKPFAFTVADDENEHLFRARSDEEMQEWIDDIQLVLNKFHPRGRVTKYALFKPVAQNPWVEPPISQQLLDDDEAAEYESSSAGGSSTSLSSSRTNTNTNNSLTGLPFPSTIPRSSSEADTKRTAATITSLPLQLSVLQASMKRTTSESSAPSSIDTSENINIRPIELSASTESPVRGPYRALRGDSALEDSGASADPAHLAGELSSDSNPSSARMGESEEESDDDDLAYFSKALKPSRRGSQYAAIVEHVRRASVAHNGSVSHQISSGGNAFAPPAAASVLKGIEENFDDHDLSQSKIPQPHHSPTPVLVPPTSTSSSSSTASTASTPSSLTASVEIFLSNPLASSAGASPTASAGGSPRWTLVRPQAALQTRMMRSSAEKPVKFESIPATQLITSQSSPDLQALAAAATSAPASPNLVRTNSSINIAKIANYHASRRKAIGASEHINSMVIFDHIRTTGSSTPRSPSPRPPSTQVDDQGEGGETVAMSPVAPAMSARVPSDAIDALLSVEQVDSMVEELRRDVAELGATHDGT